MEQQRGRAKDSNGVSESRAEEDFEPKYICTAEDPPAATCEIRLVFVRIRTEQIWEREREEEKVDEMRSEEKSKLSLQ